MVPLLAFVDIFVDPTSRADDVVGALSRLSNVVELYEVKGEFDIVTLISASSIEEFHNILHNKILNIKGVRSEVSSVVINTDKGPLTINKENAAVPACSME